MAQRYTSPVALERMSHNLCPECGLSASIHSTAPFWMRGPGCDLMPGGVGDRIDQYRLDEAWKDFDDEAR